MAESFNQRRHSTPKHHRGQTSTGQKDDQESMLSSLDDTGESTRSLLSVLSHSSIQDLPEDVLNEKSQDEIHVSSSSTSTSKSQSRSGNSKSSSSSSSSRSKSETDTQSRSSSYSPPKMSESKSTSSSQTTSSKTPPLTPWEKWLIEKTKQERKRLKVEARRKKEKQMKEEEEKKMKAEKGKVIEVKVNMWIEERTTKEAEGMRAKRRLEEMEKRLREEEKRRVEEKAKENYKDWCEKKAAEKELLNKKQRAEEKAKEDAARRKREAAEAAYQQWKQEASRRPLPLTTPFGYPRGNFKGYHDKASYPVPSFYNPVAWMPIHAPQEHTKPPAQTHRTKHTKAPSSSSFSCVRQIQQPLSPPLLFKDRASRQNSGKPR